MLHLPLLAASFALLTLHICGDGVEEGGVETLAGEFLLLLTVLTRAGEGCVTPGLGLLPRPSRTKKMSMQNESEKEEETKKRRRQNETEFSKNHFQNKNFHRKRIRKQKKTQHQNEISSPLPRNSPSCWIANRPGYTRFLGGIGACRCG